jgi:phosphatidate cytidylyltransferase
MMLKQRLVSGTLLGVMVILSATYFPSPAGWLLVLVLAMLAQYEFYGMMRAMGGVVFRMMGMLGGALLLSATFWTIGPWAEQLPSGFQQVEGIVLALLTLSILIRQVFQKGNAKPVETICGTLVGVLYGAFLLNFLIRLAFTWHEGSWLQPVSRTGQMLVFYLVAVVKAADTGAYFTGRLLGRHKMIPRLSPNKTWEGLAGGVLLSLVTSSLFHFLTGGQLGHVPLNLGHALLLGVLLSLAGTVGDLFESMLKRSAGLKDSGTLIPGMGGALDVLDSLIFGAPVLYAYVVLFLRA